MALNYFCGHGRLTNDVALKDVKDGLKMARFSIAINSNMKKDKTNFINCVAFGKTAETVSTYLKKGSEIIVYGELQSNSYEKDGRKVMDYSITVNAFDFCGSKPADAPTVVNKGTPFEFVQTPKPSEQQPDFSNLPTFENPFA